MPVKQLAAQVMDRINAQGGVTSNADVSVTEFWEKTCLPHVEMSRRRPSLRRSCGYRAIWRQNLSAVFAGFTLRDYQTHHATRYLTSLDDKGLGPKTIAHARSLGNGMFKHALPLNYISVNPWRDDGSLTPVKKGESTHAYTLEQADA